MEVTGNEIIRFKIIKNLFINSNLLYATILRETYRKPESVII